MAYAFYLFMTIVVVGTLIQLAWHWRTCSFQYALETLLAYSLFSLVGLNGLYAFMGHAFIPDQIAAYIGWPAGNPFQFEVACANLAFGVLGVLCLKIRGRFWTATIIGVTVLLWGAAFGHLRELLLHHNHAPGNAGLVLYLDIFIPLGLIVLFVLSNRLAKSA